jgi:hypothetical protein
MAPVAQSINITPKFYAVFLNVRIPVFSIGKGWSYFSPKSRMESKKYDSKECPE